MVKKYCTTCSLLVFVFTLMVATQTRAQHFDYPSHPKLDFSFSHLNLELRINPADNLLEGRAEYSVESNIDGVDSLILNAAHMDIQSVQIGGTAAEFRLENDSLIIGLNETAMAGESRTVEIIYETSPGFGVHFEADGTTWSSFLPRTTRHWVPVKDHPRVSFTTDITLTVPGDFTALAPGRKTGEEIISVEEKRAVWNSRRAIPASALWFAAGPFKSETTSFGIKQILIAGAENRDENPALLEQAYRILSSVESRLGIEYPFESLHVVVFDDHRWETKPYGAGVIYLFRNRGDLVAQLRRGIYAQWFGVHQREERWTDAEGMNLYQTAVHYEGSDIERITVTDSLNPEVSVNPYHAFSPKQWNRWQEFYSVWKDSTWKGVVRQSIQTLLTDNGEGVNSWSDYADFWYETSGQPWYQPPELMILKDTAKVDSVIYNVEYRYREMSNELVLQFDAVESGLSELVTLPLIQHISGQADSMNVTFTGQSDSVLVNLDPAVSYVTIDASGRERLRLREKKPVTFILSQLRDAGSTEEKAAAARQLAMHTDNPDLQLAVNDLLSKELDPEVRAGLLYSLGEITSGAAGTEQIFLDAIRSDHPAVRKAAIGALSHYKNNAQAVQALQRVALNTENLSMVRFAVKNLAEAADTASIRQFSQQVMSSDTTGMKTLLVLKYLPDGEAAVKKLDLLIGTNYPYHIRSQAIRLLAEQDRGSERWTSRFNNLINDNDPRIRLLAVKAVDGMESIDVASLFSEHIADEYDGRVYYEMKRVLDGERE